MVKIFKLSDLDNSGEIEPSEFNEFMANIMIASGTPHNVIRLCRRGEMKWSKIFPGLNLKSDYSLTWDDVWNKLKPIKKALPP